MIKPMNGLKKMEHWEFEVDMPLWRKTMIDSLVSFSDSAFFVWQFKFNWMYDITSTANHNFQAFLVALIEADFFHLPSSKFSESNLEQNGYRQYGTGLTMTSNFVGSSILILVALTIQKHMERKEKKNCIRHLYWTLEEKWEIEMMWIPYDKMASSIEIHTNTEYLDAILFFFQFWGVNTVLSWMEWNLSFRGGEIWASTDSIIDD